VIENFIGPMTWANPPRLDSVRYQPAKNREGGPTVSSNPHPAPPRGRLVGWPV